MTPARPPRFSAWLLRILLPTSQREFALGDLEEEFATRLEADGRRAARRHYRAEARRAIGPFLARLGNALRRPPASAPGRWLSAGAHDARFAFRAMRRRPGQAALIVATLTVGIGATTAVFSIVDRVLFRSLPFDRPDELVTIWNTYPGWQGHHVLDALWDRIGLSYPEYETWRRDQTAYEEIAVYRATQMALVGSGDPRSVMVGWATPSLWPLLGVSPLLGRLFGPHEGGPGAADVAVLHHDAWQRVWGGDAQVIGRSIRLDGRTFRVIGVLPPDFRFGSVVPGIGEATLWVPAGGEPVDRDDGNHVYEAMGRLAGGITPTAVAETQRLVTGGAPPESRGVRVTLRHTEQTKNARGPLLLLLGAVSLLMLLACVNVATLLLGRLAARRGELATRATLGAGAGRLTRQLLVEALVLAGGGVLGGYGLAFALRGVLLRWAPSELGLSAVAPLDPRILAFTAGLGALTSLAFGLVPAFIAGSPDLQATLRKLPGRGGGGRRTQNGLVAAQFAISLVLLVGTGLLTRSLVAELSVDPGFEAEGSLVVELGLPVDRYPDGASRSALLFRVTERLGALPGVTSVTGSSALPFSGRGGSSSFEIPGRVTPDSEQGPEATRRSVLPGYFETLGIPIREGRGFEAADRDGGQPVVVVSEAMESRFWPGDTAIGQAILRDNRRWEIVGVVGDVIMSDLRSAPDATFYTPIHQEEDDVRQRVSLVLGGSGDPGGLAAPAREAIWSLDPALPLEDVRPFSSVVAGSLAGQRYRTLLLADFALTATLLAGIGVFGVTGRSLVARMRELGVRVALGADPGRLLVRELGREALPLGAGVAVGLVAALAGSRLLGEFLFGITPIDPVAYAAAVVGLVAVGLGAAALAARRILRVDPVEVLRSE
ncbi:MAG: ADOP family duplicated permease [Gemmatimonadota bacterium]|nr:ADOP family duplicated permease [Gemmatimonadota bacterium]